nr:MAG: hypothetical protein DIU70_02930 [Bacillota bacterium]
MRGSLYASCVQDGSVVVFGAAVGLRRRGSTGSTRISPFRGGTPDEPTPAPRGREGGVPMARIQVNPEELRAVAAQFRKSSEESNAMVQTLSTAVRNLDNNWDGLSSEKFYQDFEQWRQEMIHFVAVLDQIHQQLMAIAQRFEEADRPA